jgi:hypothetical protein
MCWRICWTRACCNQSQGKEVSNFMVDKCNKKFIHFYFTGSHSFSSLWGKIYWGKKLKIVVSFLFQEKEAIWASNWTPIYVNTYQISTFVFFFSCQVTSKSTSNSKHRTFDFWWCKIDYINISKHSIKKKSKHRTEPFYHDLIF